MDGTGVTLEKTATARGRTMSRELENSSRSVGHLAACRRFPDKAALIEDMMGRDEDFRDLCGELADAEMALAAIDAVSADVRAARTAEWQGWIARLTDEIDQALCRGNVIPLSSRLRSIRR